jgi:hypothetical protein
MTDREYFYLDNLLAHAAKTRTFLSNRMKPERERSVSRAFLRAIGISFIDSELIAPTVEPADVAFRDARFQVRDLVSACCRCGKGAELVGGGNWDHRNPGSADWTDLLDSLDQEDQGRGQEDRALNQGERGSSREACTRRTISHPGTINSRPSQNHQWQPRHRRIPGRLRSDA